MRRSQIGRRRGGGRALRRPSALLATLLLLSCSDAANEGGTSPVPFDLAAVSDLTTIAELRPPGVNAAQISSYDRTGGNADFGLGPEAAPLLEPFGIPPLLLDNSFLYRDGERYVIFDEAGPGVVTRIWMTGLDGLFSRLARRRHRVRGRRRAGTALRRAAQRLLQRLDGAQVGVWSSAELNPLLRWAVLDFELPRSATQGKDTLEVEIDAVGSPTPWTAYGYQVWSHVAPGH